MADGQLATPFAVEILADELPVAVMRLGFRTEQAAAGKRGWLCRVSTCRSAIRFMNRWRRGVPVALLFLEGCQDILRRRKQRLMHIIGATEFFQEIRQVGGLGKTGKLGGIVQPDIDDPLHAGLPDTPEEISRRASG